MGRRSEETFFQRHTDGQQVNENVLNIVNQGNAHKSTMRYYLTPVRRAIIKKTITSVVGVRRKVNPHALLVTM